MSLNDLLSRIDVQMIHPGFLGRVIGMLAACRASGHWYWAISGYRSAAEQDALYALGRTRSGAIVTSACGFQSAHNFGIAVDFARDDTVDRAGLRPGNDPADYEVLGRQALNHGLVWGGISPLREWTHVQMPGYVTPSHLEGLRRVYLAAPNLGPDLKSRELARLKAVWRHMDGSASVHI